MIFLVCLLLAIFLPLSEPWPALLVVAGALLEIVEVLVLRRWSKHLHRTLPAETGGAEGLIGDTGEVVAPCTPEGTVRVHGELWEARCADGAGTGSRIRVDALDGLVLVVSPAPPGR